jgi:hypothetical protein
VSESQIIDEFFVQLEILGVELEISDVYDVERRASAVR